MAKIAICVGHSRKINGRRDGGAVSFGGVAEWDYNSRVAGFLREFLLKMGHQVTIYDAYQGIVYTHSMRWLGKKITDNGGADLALELHFNSSSGRACGHEWLYLSGSRRGQDLARCMELQFWRAWPHEARRGIKMGDDRGGAFLRYTPCPAVICEPFFGDEPESWARFSGEPAMQKIAWAYAEGINQFLSNQ